ncbi:MAG TPA: hypothetical protein VMM14_08285 [Acidimicrobiia bacterium]|nr:hypothetical protein [Acidimicrobiia bacterium]
MSSLEILTFVAMLVGVLLVIVAMLVWQEAKRRPSYEPLEYVINDVIKHIAERLPEDTRLNNADVRRIIEWEVFYLQGLAQDDRKNPVETVAGGHDASIEYIADRIHTKHGVSYSHEEITEVLRLEADYLVAIGAVGEPVGEEE